MISKVGKGVIIFFITSIIILMLYICLENIFEKEYYDGTFVFEERVVDFNGYIY